MKILLLLALFSQSGYPQFSEAEYREIQCLAHNIYFEARGESLQGQWAVAIVTLNRVESPKYPDTICEVVWQPKQFSWTSDGKSDIPTDKAAWKRSRGLAEHVYRVWKGQVLTVISDSQNLRDVKYYHAKYVDPHWASSKVKVADIGSHIFYR